MGVFIAVIIILGLVLYSIKDLLAEKDFSSWINIALTSLILFTVILSIFIILNKGDGVSNPSSSKTKPSAEEVKTETPEEEKSDEEVMMEIAEEYTLIENDYKTRNPDATDSEEVASGVIKEKYGFTDEEWSHFMEHAKANDLFTKAQKKINGEEIDYLIAK